MIAKVYQVTGYAQKSACTAEKIDRIQLALSEEAALEDALWAVTRTFAKLREEKNWRWRLRVKEITV